MLPSSTPSHTGSNKKGNSTMAYVKHFKTSDEWRAFIRTPNKKEWLLLDAKFSEAETAREWLRRHGYEVVMR
jgi:hypothetical protein